jgi:hypothetical protein
MVGASRSRRSEQVFDASGESYSEAHEPLSVAFVSAVGVAWTSDDRAVEHRCLPRGISLHGEPRAGGSSSRPIAIARRVMTRSRTYRVPNAQS